jgi:hypothetical protein
MRLDELLVGVTQSFERHFDFLAICATKQHFAILNFDQLGTYFEFPCFIRPTTLLRDDGSGDNAEQDGDKKWASTYINIHLPPCGVVSDIADDRYSPAGGYFIDGRPAIANSSAK